MVSVLGRGVPRIELGDCGACAMTQYDMIIAHFRQGLSLTVAEALDKYGIYALSQRCGNLKTQGWDIQSKTEHANGKHYSRYWLNHCTGCTDGQLFGAHQSGTQEHEPITKEKRANIT